MLGYGLWARSMNRIIGFATGGPQTHRSSVRPTDCRRAPRQCSIRNHPLSPHGTLTLDHAIKPPRVSLQAWIILALAVILGGFAIRFGVTFPWAATLDALGSASLLLLAGAGLINILSLMAKAGAWHLLLRRLTPISAVTAQVATFIGAAVNSISISVSGEAARAQSARSRDGVRFGPAAASLVASRVVEALGLVVFLAVVLVALPMWPGARRIGLLLAAVLLLITAGYHLLPRKRWHPVLAGLAATGPLGLAAPTALATLNWALQWLAYHWSFVATGAAVTPAVSLAALVMANIAGILRLTPGNIGIMQGSLVLGMQAFAMPPANALAAGLALQAVQVIPILMIGIAILGAQGFQRIVAHRDGTESEMG
jgi:putative heme transporter